MAIKTISHNDTCKGSGRSAPELGGRADVYEVSIKIWRSDKIHADYFEPLYQWFNITNGLTLSTEDLFSTFQYVGTLNIYFLVHFKKWYP